MFFCNQSPHIPGFVVLLMIGFAVCSIAIVTPAWQVTVVPELNMTVQHGLWMSCQKRMHGIFVCLYSFAEQDDYNKTATRELSVFSPIFAGYQHFVLSLFIFAQVLVFLCIGLYAVSKYIQLHSHISFFYDIATVVASILCAAGCIIFAIFSKLEKYSAFDGETTTHQFQLQLRMSRSFSFYMMIGGALIYVAAFVSCILHRLQNARKITIGSSHGRSMDDDDDATFSKGVVRKLTPHPRQNSIIA
uniref:Clc-like protein 2 n=1 Tax=Ascaris suum TaxID=6253 RepID=F1L5Z7_ASCSU